MAKCKLLWLELSLDGRKGVLGRAIGVGLGTDNQCDLSTKVSTPVLEHHRRWRLVLSPFCEVLKGANLCKHTVRTGIFVRVKCLAC